MIPSTKNDFFPSLFLPNRMQNLTDLHRNSELGVPGVNVVWKKELQRKMKQKQTPHWLFYGSVFYAKLSFQIELLQFELKVPNSTRYQHNTCHFLIWQIGSQTKQTMGSWSLFEKVSCVKRGGKYASEYHTATESMISITITSTPSNSARFNVMVASDAFISN